VEFGFPDFSATVFAEHGPALMLAYEHSHLANKMIGALPTLSTKYPIQARPLPINQELLD
jgi:hypothetical protein